MKIVLAYVLMISLTVLANLLLKTGASAAAASGSGTLSALFNWRIGAGLVSFALGACAYILVLTRLPLNVAQSIAALQFVAVILAAWLLLGEPISGPRWIGIAMIVGGIVLVGRSIP